jgi:hypothetical protein
MNDHARKAAEQIVPQYLVSTGQSYSPALARMELDHITEQTERATAIIAQAIADATAELRATNERLEQRLARWESDPLAKGAEPNPIDTIAATRGWLPLVPREAMTVHFNGIGYRIQREPFDATAEQGRRAEWAELLAQLVGHSGGGWTGRIWNMLLPVPKNSQRFDVTLDANGLPIETPELRAALEAALNKE